MNKQEKEAKSKAKELKKELRVVRKKMSRHTAREILGDDVLHAGDQHGEWEWIRTNFRKMKLWYPAKYFVQTFGCVMVPPLGVLMMLRAAVCKNHLKEVGDEFADKNIEHGQDWWFVNAMAVNSDLMKSQAKHMSHIFEKKIHMFYNPTLGLLFDVAQCMTGIIGYTTKITKRFAKVMISRLNDQSIDRNLVLISHSQGCIIVAGAISYMIKKGHAASLARLECYTFGSPQLEWFTEDHPTVSGAKIPFYEHYANENDFVSKIGILRGPTEGVDMHGKLFTSKTRGHMLGEHYLTRLRRHEFTCDGSEQGSRLYEYLKVGRESHQDAATAPINTNVNTNGNTNVNVNVNSVEAVVVESVTIAQVVA